MKKYLVILVVLAITGLSGYFALHKESAKPVVEKSCAFSPEPDCSVSDEAVIEALNQERSKVGASPVVASEYLNQLAENRALEQNGTLDDHAGFKKIENTLDWYHYQSISEELSFYSGCHNSSERLLGFRSSSSHWDSLMRPSQDSVGVGFYKELLVVELGDLK